MKTIKLIGVAAALLAAQLASAQPPGGGPPGGMQPPQFKDFDANADGKIVQEEFSASMQRMMANMPQGQGGGNANAAGGAPGAMGMGMEQMFGRWDANSDGGVTQEEFDARPRGMGMGGQGGPQGQGGAPR